jgi:hypothetical protein
MVRAEDSSAEPRGALDCIANVGKTPGVHWHQDSSNSGKSETTAMAPLIRLGYVPATSTTVRCTRIRSPQDIGAEGVDETGAHKT